VSRRVVITGMGAVTPLGIGADVLFRRWAGGECGIEDGVGRCDDFDPADFISQKVAHRSDRFTQLALAASDEALENAGWSEELPYASARTGCVIGTGIGGLGSLEEQHHVLIERGPRKISALSVPLMMGNAASAAVAMRHQLHGQTFGVVSACAAGAHAIGTAVGAIRSGSADAAVAGGSEAALTPLAEAAFAKMGAISECGISRPFDRRRDGFVMG
jgi:3-oxoacyl-[acyl-carrier-protein] synthase II